ncbi:MAG: Ig-like domain-containing protein, partial [Muribaculaceae bacterium]|nr:Ig-like domain-containing protein [Muribaculaceae bacterium]
MSKKLIYSILLWMMLVAPFAVSADRFYVNPVDLEVGKSETLQFILENSQDCYGFQATVTLPDGIEVVKGSDGELDISLSNRAESGDYRINSNVLSDGSLIMGAFSGTHDAISGNDGVLVDLKVSVAEDFKGGTLEISNAMYINDKDEDVTLPSSSASLGVMVTGITLSDTSLSLKEGGTTTLTAIVTPAGATGKTVTWESSDETVATVDKDGKVTAIKEGTATITASCGGKTATCAVTVIIAVTGITLDKTELNLTEGDTATLIVTVNPENATDKTVTWTSNDADVATVDEDGQVTAVKAGTATITASCGDKTVTCTVTVSAKVIAVTGITLDKTELSLTEGEGVKLTATVTPDNATDKTVTWTSSDETVATVDENGNVTAVKAGSATIIASSGGKTASCTVAVTAKVIAVTGITLDKTELSLTEGDTAALTATVAPDNATDKTVTWTSSDEAVATADKNGNVTAVKVGTATITASCGDKTATCTVTVSAKVIAVTGITLDKTELSLTEGDTATLTATVAPEDATNNKVTWASSDETVATVDDAGNVTAFKAGTA